MTVVTSITEIEENLQLLENYLYKGTDKDHFPTQKTDRQKNLTNAN